MNLKERFHIKIVNTVKNTAADITRATSRARTTARQNPTDFVYILDTKAPEGADLYYGVDGRFLPEQPILNDEDVKEAPKKKGRPKGSKNKKNALVPVQTWNFEGHQLTSIHYKGEQVWITKEVGRVLGYADDGQELVNSISKWFEDFDKNIDYIKLDGLQLAEFKRLFVDNGESPLSNKAQRIILLTESGLHLACIKSQKEIGRRLRQWISREVLPALRKEGSYTLPKHRKTLEEKQRDQEKKELRKDINLIKNLISKEKDYMKDGYKAVKDLCKMATDFQKKYPEEKETIKSIELGIIEDMQKYGNYERRKQDLDALHIDEYIRRLVSTMHISIPSTLETQKDEEIKKLNETLEKQQQKMLHTIEIFDTSNWVTDWDLAEEVTENFEELSKNEQVIAVKRINEGAYKLGYTNNLSMVQDDKRGPLGALTKVYHPDTAEKIYNSLKIG